MVGIDASRPNIQAALKHSQGDPSLSALTYRHTTAGLHRHQWSKKDHRFTINTHIHARTHARTHTHTHTHNALSPPLVPMATMPRLLSLTHTHAYPHPYPIHLHTHTYRHTTHRLEPTDTMPRPMANPCNSLSLSLSHTHTHTHTSHHTTCLRLKIITPNYHLCIYILYT